jgi:hypothetical protein
MTRRVLTVLAMTLAASGCLGSALNGNDGGGGGGSGGSGTVDMTPDVVGQFYSQVQPILVPACGGCHGVTGTAAPAFMLATPDMLQNILAYPGIVGATPAKSRLYAKGPHEGPALTPDQQTVIGNWITFYNMNRPMTDGGGKAVIAPFTPQMTGTNTIDLSALDSTLAGMKLTFIATKVGTSIQLSQLKLVTTPSMGIHVVHPLFVVWDQNLNPTPDPVDSFSNLDETVFSGQSIAMGPGTLLLPNFAAGDLINVVFTTIEAKMGSADGGTVSGCKNLTMFVNNVKPLLMANGCTANCHVGTTPTAGLAWDATPDSALCINARSEIDTTTPANSRLLSRPDPAGDPSHPSKVNPFTNFQTAVTNWINAEK